MIKIVRFGAVGTAGLATTILMFSSFPGPASFVILAVSLIWLTAALRFKMIHSLVLPLFTIAVLIGLLYGLSPLKGIFLFIIILSAWEIDAFYLDGYRDMKKEEAIRLMLPLILTEVLSLILTVSLYLLTENKGLRIGFWPLIGLVIVLIFTLRRLFSIKN